jgi:hypothetical protein
MDHLYLGRHRRPAHALRGIVLPALLLLSTAVAHAADGCKVLLCLAGNWKNIAACEPEVRQALRDVSRGRGWPSCSTSSGGGDSSGGAASQAAGSGTADDNPTATRDTSGQAASSTSSVHQWAWAPGNCPQQYTIELATETGLSYACRYSGVISVWINGRLWSQTWWDAAGDTSTDYSPEARARLVDAIDSKFDNDRAAAAAATAAVTASSN